MFGNRIARNVVFNWVALASTAVVGFFLSPFVVHHLGNIGYGVWVLVISLSSYMNLLDVGMRGAVTRFVSKGVTQGNHDEANQAISGALWIRYWISGVIIVGSFLLALSFNRMFPVPASLHRTAQVAVLFTGVTIALNLSCGVFGGVLAALHRFDLLSTVNILTSVLRAAGYVVLLRAGYGILALALWDLINAVVTNALQVVFTFRVYPQMRVFFGRPSREVIRKLWGYSFYSFLINVAIQLVYYSDNLVVGAFTTAAAVTLYAIGGFLINYARQIVASMTTTFGPLASMYEASGQPEKLRRLLIQGTRAALIVSLPIELALFFRGHTFIGLWMGHEYAGPSGTVLQILLISMMVGSANTTSGGIVYGIEKHKMIAFFAIAEGIVNLALSIILVHRIGIYGVAWGTTIPSVLIELLLWPPYISRLVGIPMWQYVWQTWIRTSLAAVPFAVACYLSDRYWTASNLFTFFMQILVLLPLFAGALAVIFWHELSQSSSPQLRRLIPWHVVEH